MDKQVNPDPPFHSFQRISISTFRSAKCSRNRSLHVDLQHDPQIIHLKILTNRKNILQNLFQSQPPNPTNDNKICKQTANFSSLPSKFSIPRNDLIQSL